MKTLRIHAGHFDGLPRRPFSPEETAVQELCG
jgi:hypothetical protein